jgi:two-component system, NarL family, response regulator NreC
LRILLADDHQVVREGLRALLERGGHVVVAEAGDGRDAVDLARRVRPDLAVLDISMPLLNGIDATRAIVNEVRGARVVVLTMSPESQYALAALQAGARGYVLKSQAGSDLLRAVQDVGAGGTYLSPGVSDAVLDAWQGKTDAGERLTPREREVLQLVVEGKATKEVAALLHISVKTVETHRANIMEKLRIYDVPNLVRYAIRQGLIQP